MALTKLTSNLIEGGTGTDWVTAIQTSNFTAAAGKGYFVNTTSQVLYVNLPVGVVGMEITIQDYAGTFATNKVILNANGSEKIQGSAFEGRINTNNATAVLIYQDATKGWTSQDVELNVTTISWATPTGQSLTYSTPSPQSSQGAAAATFPTTTFTATLTGSTISGTATIAGLPSGITAAQTITGSGTGNTLTVTLTGTFPSINYLNTALTLSGLTIVTPLLVSYLVVAGGGGSSWAGGGAGGYRNSFNNEPSGGGGSSENELTLVVSTNYALTVGGGGAAGVGDNSDGGDGSNSVFSTITSIGGGGGDMNSSTGRPGGSGGGASNGQFQGGAGTAGQGFAGGSTSGATNSGCGGGGASQVGLISVGYAGADGGSGLESSITGTATYRAGGGGGGGRDGSTTGSGGSGGGGNASTSYTANNNTAGAINTGGGGGGSTYNNSGGWNASRIGGSGIVILRYPSSYTISGLSGTTTIIGSEKVTTFLSGTGNIQFN